MRLRALMADRRAHWIAGGVAALLAGFLIILAAFPWDMLRAVVVRRASEQIGRPVTIGAIERRDAFSFTPTVVIHDVRVPQSAWAGPGELARIGTATVRFPVWPLLIGRFKPLEIEISGLRLALSRDENGRENWHKTGAPEPDDGGAPILLDSLVLRDTRVIYRDALRDRAFSVQVISDAKRFRINGVGRVLGTPVQVSASGPAIAGRERKAWPFRAQITGDALAMAAIGRMDRPLDTHHLVMDVKAEADDFRLIDAIIEAGLISTQRVRLTAHVTRDGETWDIQRLAGIVGKTDLAGHVLVRKIDGRHRIDAALTSDHLTFDDFASNEGIAQAAAASAADGPRLVPATRIDIGKIDRTDGVIDFTVHHLVDNKGASALAAVRGRATMDHQLLTLDPLVFTMTRGTLEGTVRVDQRGGRQQPIVSLDLAVKDSSLGTIAGTGGGAVDARFDAHAVLSGTGSTIREAVGRSSGRIGVVARDGQLPAKLASYLGFDAGRGLFTGSDEEAGLRCMALRLDVRGGVGHAGPMVIDTTRSQARGDGTVTFPGETLDLNLVGQPKQKIVLRLPGAILVRGTIERPDISAQEGMKSAGNIMKAIGRAISGDQGPLAEDADCDALARRALQ